MNLCQIFIRKCHRKKCSVSLCLGHRSHISLRLLFLNKIFLKSLPLFNWRIDEYELGKSFFKNYWSKLVFEEDLLSTYAAPNKPPFGAMIPYVGKGLTGYFFLCKFKSLSLQSRGTVAEWSKTIKSENKLKPKDHRFAPIFGKSYFKDVSDRFIHYRKVNQKSGAYLHFGAGRRNFRISKVRFQLSVTFSSFDKFRRNETKPEQNISNF